MLFPWEVERLISLIEEENQGRFLDSEKFTLDSSEIEPKHTYSEAGKYVVRLQITDDIGFCADSSKLLVKTKGLLPPGWKPTSLLNKFLSQISSILLQ